MISSFTGSGVGTDFLLLTEPFNMVAIPGSTDLYLRFQIDYCYDAAAAECTDVSIVYYMHSVVKQHIHYLHI